MRLLSSENETFKDDFDHDGIPTYAILSHCWSKDMNQPEVTYQDYLESIDRSDTRFDKINKCRALAAFSGIEWVWIDTCCIDKRSGAELSESINSMYRWYAKAHICYAYLDDVGTRDIQGSR